MANAGDTGSTLLLDEYFASSDPRFFPELLATRASRPLKGLAQRWYNDRRAFAREMLLRYIDDGCLRPGHRGLVKSLFKCAEAANDDEAMGRFMVAIDAMPRREMREVPHWNWSSNRMETAPRMLSARGLPTRTTMRRGNANDLTFTRLTRQYLARRAWRYFRRIGYRDQARYLTAMQHVLPRYRDENLTDAARLLDAWGLVNALYWNAPNLVRRSDGVKLRANTVLADLIPAPIFPKVWAGAFETLLSFVEHAQSRVVRGWALTLLRDGHVDALRQLPLARIRALLSNANDEAIQLGGELLKTARGLESLPIDAWLELLTVQDVSIVTLVSDLVAKYVAPDRLDLAQCIDLAGARIAPVASLGLRWTRTKPVRTANDLELLTRLANAKAPLVRREAVEWVLSVLAQHPQATAEHVREFVDSRFADTRATTLQFVKQTERFRDALVVWSSLAESPYDDARGALLDRMNAWSAQMPPASLHHLWATAILSVHRGNRTRPRVLRQVAERIAARPDEASALLPLLRFMLRSVRSTERRAAVAAIGRAVYASAGLRSVVQRELPELVLWNAELS